MKRKFSTWLSTMRETLYGFSDYVDFDKAQKNTLEMRHSIACMSSLIGEADIEKKFLDLAREHQEIKLCVPYILAKREKSGKGAVIPVLDKDNVVKYFSFSPQSILSDEDCAYFLRETGIFDLLKNRKISNLSDYIFGVEVGLDTHARKNRTGKLMETAVEKELQRCKVSYSAQVSRSQGSIIESLDKKTKDKIFSASKKYDFVVSVAGELYFIETNFYSRGGSKPSTISRLYNKISSVFASLNNIHFVWITDGPGWNAEKGDLEKAYKHMPHLYNLSDIENGTFAQLFEK